MQVTVDPHLSPEPPPPAPTAPELAAVLRGHRAALDTRITAAQVVLERLARERELVDALIAVREGR